MSPCSPRSRSWSAGYASVSSTSAARGAIRARASVRTRSRIRRCSSVREKRSRIGGIIALLLSLRRFPARPLERRCVMARLWTNTRLVGALAAITLVLAAGLYAVAQQMDESKRARTVPVGGGKYHVLPATLETTQWGWLDPKEPPKLVVNSGDVVAVETMMHAHNKIQPGSTMEEIVALRKANPGGGPMSVTGPIYVNGAQPGDVMEVAILKIVPKAFAFNFNLPGAEFPTIGALAPEFPQGWVRYFYLDWEKRRAEFKAGITIDLDPAPGTLAVGIDPDDPSPRKGGATDPMAPVSGLRPWKNASNMDLNELKEGT